MIIASLEDYRQAAKRRLPHFLFEYIDGGAFSETTLRNNQSDLQSIALRQRVLRDLSQLDLSTQILGQKATIPLALAPVGIAGLNARRGEVQAAQAAEEFGVPFCLSTVSACSIEEVRKGTQNACWFQLYMLRDRGFVQEMLDRARAVGTETLIFTVDMPLPATRYRDMRSGLSYGSPLQRKITRARQVLTCPSWAWDVGVMGRPHSLGNVVSRLGKNAGIDEFWSWLGQNFDPSVTWKDIEAVRAAWPGKLVIKGILDAEDARIAASVGCDGLIVSNHGGRQLDGALSSIKALPRIAEAAGNDLEVYLDGGVRSGLDIVRAIALGAKAVFIGRPWVYALAARQKRGVLEVLNHFANEMRIAMGLSGHTKVVQITKDSLEKI